MRTRQLRQMHDYLLGLIKNRLWLQVLIGMFLGIVLGILMGPGVGWVEPGRAATIGNWLALPGKLFISIIQMIVIPLVFASVIRGISASQNLEQLRNIGIRSVLFFVVTTIVAIAVGCWLALLIQPGNWIDSAVIEATLGSLPQKGESVSAVGGIGFDRLPHAIIGLLPNNPLNSMVEGEMLQIVLFAVMFGIALLVMSAAQAKPLLDLMSSLQEVCMTFVRWAMVLAPFAVFGLLTQLTSQIGLNALVGMGMYVLTVLGGLVVLFVFFVLLAVYIGRRSPLYFLRSTRELLLLAFSTSSSAAVMPLSIKTVEEKFKVRTSISQFVIPLGATINMNGTALYQGVATVFLAQVFGIELTVASLVLVIVTAVGASIGSPATPGVGIVVLAMVLDAVGVPSSGIALLMGVDRILDMSRTVVNVSGDVVACLLLERVAGREVQVSKD